jgi:glutamate N-acetyltransferase/amino-acid N-acetyltransferase
MIVPGFRLSGVAAGIKKKEGALDLGLVVADAPCAAAAVFTRNRVKAAPVLVAAERVRRGRSQALLVNAGCANACTGQPGLAATKATTAAAARALGIAPELVLPASTGVIGAVLPRDKVEAALPALIEALSPSGLADFSRAILTTDAGPKVAVATPRVSGGMVAVVGVAKGAGMICPDMATTLAFVLTDAAVAPAHLRQLLRQSADATFNAITVDGDTSTNDTIVVLASGRTGRKVAPGSADARRFGAALTEVLAELARRIVADGEGATKVVEVVVRGAPSAPAARAVARRIAGSPLSKTAFFGEDPNWGRWLAAAGAAGVAFDPARAQISVGGIPIVRRGRGLGAAAEEKARAVMRGTEYRLQLDLGAGDAEARLLTCDLGLEYVRINADYRS